MIGAAEPVLNPSDIDHFLDMTELEKLYSLRNRAWISIIQAGALKRKILSSKISTCDIGNTLKLMGIFKNNLDYLRDHSDKNEPGLFDQLTLLITELSPKIEVVACLSSPTLRTNHWLWISENILRYCGLSLKLAGQSSEIITGKNSNTIQYLYCTEHILNIFHLNLFYEEHSYCI